MSGKDRTRLGAGGDRPLHRHGTRRASDDGHGALRRGPRRLVDRFGRAVVTGLGIVALLLLAPVRALSAGLFRCGRLLRRNRAIAAWADDRARARRARFVAAARGEMIGGRDRAARDVRARRLR